MRYLILLLPFLLGCHHHPKQHSHAFYYWKFDDQSFSGVDTALISQLHVDHFYIHYFDVDWSESLDMPIPKGSRYHYSNNAFLVKGSYCPVVFITNRTFEQLAADSCEWLAGKITDKVNAMTDQFEERAAGLEYKEGMNWQEEKAKIKAKRAPLHKEVQIDCDWTPSTRDKYFHFLRAFKALNKDRELSATIRLYPYKYYRKMGIPPIDRGMLMCYNMDRIDQMATANSVFDEKVLNSYLSGTHYPLPLDVSFPVFGWYAWFRGGKFKGIIHDGSELAGAGLINSNNIISRDTVLDGRFYREGDRVRREYPDSTTLKSAIDLAMKKVPEYRHVTFYHWDPTLIAAYENIIQETFADY
ncbi:hypothetical protein [[Flexibacter] sp. ATCC 35208]|uniref:hypothetical protein n=1 Tax=[Flexibacter] sp. ATCC 35208 TaxID=1936242 RepID=UPI0009D2250B|nr:hypothetical protein [[Flexibacter] sp. ATCC 35208]OMP80193.1 hypothetical protein BW716_05140 [[Flexibacter] sp. ATCC 35208]